MTEYEKIIILQISKIITAGCWRSVKRAGFFGPCSIREKCAVGSGCSDPRDRTYRDSFDAQSGDCSFGSLTCRESCRNREGVCCFMAVKRLEEQ